MIAPVQSAVSPAALRRRQVAMLLGYNLPVICWLGYALLRPWVAAGGLWCPTHALLGWCPSCGLTTEFSAFLYAGRWPSPLAAAVLLGFAGLAGWSLHRCQQVGR